MEDKRGEDYFLWTISQIKRKFTFALYPRCRRTHSRTRGPGSMIRVLGLESIEPLVGVPREGAPFQLVFPDLCVESFGGCHYKHLTKRPALERASNFKNTSLPPALSNKQINWTQGRHCGKGLLQSDWDCCMAEDVQTLKSTCLGGGVTKAVSSYRWKSPRLKDQKARRKL